MQEEIGFPFTIRSITYSRNSGGYGWAGNFSMKMCHVTIDELSSTFTDNYIEGSLIEVVCIDSLSLNAGCGEPLEIVFDQPFHYNGEDNLLIDIYYDQGFCESSVFNWEASPARSVCTFIFPPGSTPSQTGTLSSMMPYMIIEGEMELAGMTFAGIKVVLGSAE